MMLVCLCGFVRWRMHIGLRRGAYIFFATNIQITPHRYGNTHTHTRLK